jgi:hypothetical protein
LIRLELTASGGTTPYHTELIRVEVNVDRTPTTVSQTPRFSARHRARAVKVQPEMRGISALITSVRPLLSWTPQPVRVGMTASFWIGFEPTNYAKKAWAQAGVEVVVEEMKKIASEPSNDQTKSFIYCEIAADYDAFAATGNTRYFTREKYPTLHCRNDLRP